jgi:hypothetical protein
MKNYTYFIVIFFILVGFNCKAQQIEVLSNESIVGMYSKNLPVSIIIGKIKSSKNNFDINTEALISLTNNKLPEEIINAMVEAANDISKHVVKFDPNNPMDMHESGIYYSKKNGDKPELVQLEPSIYSQNKSSGALASALTYGIAKVKISVTLDGKDAQLQLTETQPVFYFYFDLTGKPLSQTSNWWFSIATSPNEFILVKLSENKKTREVTTGSANISGSSIGVDDKNKAVFKVEKIAPGIYKLFFEKPLSGEYCFMYAGNVPSGFEQMNKVFDFGIATK